MLSAPTRYSDGNRSVSVRQNMKLAIRRFGGREDNSAGQTNIQCARAVERIRRTARPPAYSTIRAAGQGQGAGVWRVRTKPRYEYRAAGTGTCAAAARRRQRESG